MTQGQKRSLTWIYPTPNQSKWILVTAQNTQHAVGDAVEVERLID
jgi:hypothetical protein